MSVETIPPWLVVVVVSVALIIGSASLVNSNFVWYKHRLFGMAGTVLSFTGLILIGLSIWGNVHIKTESLEIDLQKISELLQKNPEATQLVSSIVNSDDELRERLITKIADQNPRLVTSSIAKSIVASPNGLNKLASVMESIDDPEAIAFVDKLINQEITDASREYYAVSVGPEKVHMIDRSSPKAWSMIYSANRDVLKELESLRTELQVISSNVKKEK